jgi:hypothetical protein
MDWSDNARRTSDSIDVSRELDSNLIDEGDLENEKQFEQRVIEYPMEWRLIEVMKMFSIYFVSVLNLIQIKLLKVMDKIRNNLIQEFQHCMESELIEGMMMKMLLIQFVSNVNLIQMWLMKEVYSVINSLIQESQYCCRSQIPMISKYFESICDGEHQSENRFQ